MTEGSKQQLTVRKGVSVSPRSGAPTPRNNSRKGIPNKATTSFRETVTKLLEDNRENVAIWLKQLAEGTPAVLDKKGNVIQPAKPGDVGMALQRLGYLAEFAAPRLSRQETVGDGGGPLTVVIKREGE